MDVVQLFDASCALVGVVDDYESLTFVRSYSGVGDWTMVLSNTPAHAALVYAAAYIRIGAKRAGLIAKIRDAENTDEKAITVTGVELKGLASKRIVYPPAGVGYMTYSGSPEGAIAALIGSQITSPSITVRRIPGTIAAYTAGSESHSYSGRYSVLVDDIATIAATYGIGWYADIENGGIVWHIFRGIDRSASQAAHARLLIASKLDSYAGSVYEEARHQTNVALVAGQGEGADREIAVVNDAAAGLARTEMFVDARDIEDVSALPQRGLEKLAEIGDAATFEPTPEYGALLSGYMVDYDLGDVGTFLDDAVDFRLTSITEVYEVGQPPLVFGFGYEGVLSVAASLSGMSARVQALEADGIASLGRLGIKRGYTGSVSVAASAYTDVPVTFATPFAVGVVPVVLVTLRATGTTLALWANTQYAIHTISNAGFTIRFWNNYASTYTVSFAYTAMLP